MHCTHCNRSNRIQALYCKRCGTILAPSEGSNPIDDLIGMEQVKKELTKLVETCEMLSLRVDKSGVKIRLGMDMVITGKTGTGKTKLVEVLQKLLFDKRIITKSKAVIVDAVEYEKFSKEEEWEANIERARGGLLVIENAHKLVPQKESDDINKLDKLFKCMNDEWNKDPIVVLSGLTGLKAFMNTNLDISSRFEYHFDLKDLSVNELTQICLLKLQQDYNLTVTKKGIARLERVFTHIYRNRNNGFENGHYAARKADEIFATVIRRDHSAYVADEDDIPGTEFKRKSYDEIMAELDQFVGLDEIRNAIAGIVQKIENEQERKGGNSLRKIQDHFLFLGNPGTGKTTIARIFADILNSLEVLPTGQLVEVSRKDLVGAYVGHTALAVEDAVQRAMGGVLFIDEAYSLKQDENDSFGQEAIVTLMKLVDDNRGKMVAIAAGYEKEMADFINVNSGMSSRFNETIHFRDYNAEELTEIFRRLVAKEGLTLDEQANRHIGNFFQKIYISRNPQTFGNAREVRNLFDKALKNQALRLHLQRRLPGFERSQLMLLTRADIEGEENLREKDLDTILAELDQFIGMESVKYEIRKLATRLMMEKKMMEKGFGQAELTNVHIAITGNPGTGKTTIANKLGEIFHAIGLLPTARVVTKEPKDILSSLQNDSSTRMDKACDEAMGGTLVIDEAYNLARVDHMGNVDETGQQAVEALMTRMSRDAGKFVVIIAGYRDLIDRFIRKANPGLQRRFTTRLHIEDYTAPELIDIFKMNAEKKGLRLTQQAEELLGKQVHRMVETRNENFGNAGEVIKLLEETRSRKAGRLTQLMHNGVEITKELYLTIEADDIPYEESKPLSEEVYMQELDQLIGLEGVKQNVREIADLLRTSRLREQTMGKRMEPPGDHYLFLGNPGTGKTTVGRIMARIFHSLDLLPTDKLLECSRDNLVVGYQGQTAPRVREVVQSAMGGVLFIDEAYALNQSPYDSFGQEATDTLLKLMEDYRGRFICIAAGYTREMSEWVDSNSGLRSRFNKKIYFDDYDGEELARIFLLKAAGEQLILTPEAEKAMRNHFAGLYAARDSQFGNAREVNNYFKEVVRHQGSRLQKMAATLPPDREQLCTLTVEDFTGEDSPLTVEE